MAVNNLAAYLPTRRDGDETTRECSEFSAEEIATSMTQSGSVVAVANNTLARMGSRLNMHANAEPIPQEPMDAIDEQTIAWMGSTLNMHANAEPIPQEPMDTIDEQTIAWMGSTLNMHANAETMPQEPMDAIDEQAVAWMGSTLNMHANAEPIPQISRDVLQNRDTLGSHGAIASLEVEHRDPESHIPNETSNNSSQYHWSVPRQQTHWDVVVK
ncbi:hypothetical protein PENANT_c070G09000 [Penicillium antarcticum]|uniref:Uncharacterized protein n=1 Tax=Penicillium antarcticum TaxID=416450 RepID=A0A1V6PPN5_9EURO|nr:hypothetical protein PENANT_c070G09000 [Penicillium antarcticum]